MSEITGNDTGRSLEEVLEPDQVLAESQNFIKHFYTALGQSHAFEFPLASVFLNSALETPLREPKIQDVELRDDRGGYMLSYDMTRPGIVTLELSWQAQSAALQSDPTNFRHSVVISTDPEKPEVSYSYVGYPNYSADSSDEVPEFLKTLFKDQALDGKLKKFDGKNTHMALVGAKNFLEFVNRDLQQRSQL